MCLQIDSVSHWTLHNIVFHGTRFSAHRQLMSMSHEKNNQIGAVSSRPQQFKNQFWSQGFDPISNWSITKTHMCGRRVALTSPSFLLLSCGHVDHMCLFLWRGRNPNVTSSMGLRQTFVNHYIFVSLPLVFRTF